MKLSYIDLYIYMAIKNFQLYKDGEKIGQEGAEESCY